MQTEIKGHIGKNDKTYTEFYKYLALKEPQRPQAAVVLPP